MMDGPDIPPRWKIDATGSEWGHRKIAVFRSFRLFGTHIFWWPVHYASSVDEAERYVKEASRLPRYYR